MSLAKSLHFEWPDDLPRDRKGQEIAPELRPLRLEEKLTIYRMLLALKKSNGPKLQA